MEVRPGYKQTEVGVIPEEWEVKLLGEFASVTAGGTPSRTNAKYWNGDIPWVTTSEVDSCAINHAEQFITKEGLHSSAAKLLPPGTLLMALYGQGKTRGKVGVLGFEAATNQACAAISLKHGVSREFIFHFLASEYDAIRRLSNTGNQDNLNSSLIRSIAVPLPCEAEQRAIAAALSDVDALLGGLDRLIAKKRDLKQAAMQQLLTGQTRLPGFRGRWEMLNMAQKSLLKARIGWQGLTTAEYLPTGTYYLVTGTDFLAGRVSWTTCPFVAAERYEQDRNIQLGSGDVLVTKDGTIGKVAFVDQLPGPATLNSGVFVIRPKGDAYEPKFLYYILSSEVFESFLRKLAAGSTISHLYQKDFVAFQFLAPPSLDEQRAVAEALGDMEAQVAALEARRDKTRALKQAMMQELLTGKTRLVPPEAAHA